MSTSFRNTAFLSFVWQGIRKYSDRDASLLVLIVANLQKRAPALFCHYRKQRLLKNADESLLFFSEILSKLVDRG